MLKLFFWLRYLRKKKIVFLSIAAVGLSCALLIVVASLFDGFIKAVEQTGREAFGDIYLNPRERIADCDVLIDRLEALPQVEAASALLDTYGLLRLGAGDVRPIRILGINASEYSKITEFKNYLLTQKQSPEPVNFTAEGHPDEKAVLVSIGVLESPDEQTDQYDFESAKSWLGEEVVLTTVAVTEETEQSGRDESKKRFKPKHLKLRIADIVFTGMYLRDSRDVYLPIEQVRELIGAEKSSRFGPNEEIQIRVAEGIVPQQMIEPIRKLWVDFAREHNFSEEATNHSILRTSKQMQRYFIAELRKQMGLLMLIFGVICSVGVLLIFCIFYMIVMTKQKDIAVIKSCGASSYSVVTIFLGFGACVGVVGSALGAGLGFIVTKNVNTIEEWIRVLFGLKLWKSSVYVFEKIPNQIDVSASGWIILFSILAASLGALLPAIVAARTRPVEILRYE